MFGDWGSLIDDYGRLLVVFAILGTIAAAGLQAAGSYLLLRRMYAGELRGTRAAVTGTLFALALAKPSALVSRAGGLFRLARIRIEHEIFEPRPEWRWPLSDDDDAYGKPGVSLDFRGKSDAERVKIRDKSRKETIRRFREERREWGKTVRAIKHRRIIKLDNAGTLNAELSVIKRYFDTLKTLERKLEDDLKFICPVKIATGFVAPQHLLTGLLVRYNEKWNRILEGFESDTASANDLPLGDESIDFRQIQSFIYHCWLLWGPSVPVCNTQCGWWEAKFTTLQYGFGDEANSIEIVGEPTKIVEAVDKLLTKLPRLSGAMALPASVIGQLQYSSVADLNQSNIPFALEASWSGTQDERPVLFITTDPGFEIADPDTPEAPPIVAAIGPEEPQEAGRARRRSPTDSRSMYYSSYFWVMFVLLKQNPRTGAWYPLHPDPENPMGTCEPWRDTIPFFEHGNMADPETCAFAKHQLAEKALAGLGQFVDGWTPGEFPLRFAYASAIDDPNCGTGLAYPRLAGGDSIRKIVETRLAAAVADAPASAIARLKSEALILFDYYDGGTDRHPHSGCAQPLHVQHHYRKLDEKLAAED